MQKRFIHYLKCWRRRGTARMDHRFWLHWVIFGPSI
jgi:hypothetical protein